MISVHATRDCRHSAQCHINSADSAIYCASRHRNSASWNADDGIDVESTNTLLTGNWATGNGDLGIEVVTGVTDGGGNRAFGNGNGLQCSNISCRRSLCVAVNL